MGKSLAACGALMLLAATAPVSAQEMPWCVKLDVFTRNCAFANYDECLAVAKNATGPATGVGQCIRNPDYKAPATAASQPKPAAGKASSPQR